MNFNQGLDPVYSLAKRKKALLEPINKKGDVKTVPGKFGNGVWIRDNISLQALGYNVQNVLTGKGGTIEFWYKPDWDENSKSKRFPKWTPSLNIFQSGAASLNKSQYNLLIFDVSRHYRNICNVMVNAKAIFKKGEWVHIAVSWDKEEARIFVNGNLQAVSDDWNLDYFTPAIYLGGREGSGTFDELRISNNKRYVSSFKVYDAPFKIPEQKGTKRLRNDIAEIPVPHKSDEQKNLTFHTDFSRGIIANFAKGNHHGRSNRKLEIDKSDGKYTVHLKSFPDTIDDTLCYERNKNFNTSLSTVGIILRPSEKINKPAIIFDCTRILSFKQGRTGIVLLLDKDNRLKWRCLDNNRIMDEVVSPPLVIKSNLNTKIGFTWACGTIKLYVNGEKVAEKNGCPVPAMFGNYIFIGSDSSGKNSFDGLIKEISITCDDKLTK